MYDELVKRLRNRRICIQQSNGLDDFPLLREAADALEELSGENESLAKSVNEASEILRKRWIPVTERLPDEEKREYWCYTDAGVMCECRWTNNKYGLGASDKWGWNIMDVPQYQKVTHWMPLPEPPKEET